MFRALLWKEWREMWMLPAVAAPLAAIGFFAAKGYAQRLTPGVWDTGFVIWLLAAAAFIPTQVFARERGTSTADFLFSKPVDRFRLWWLKLLTCVAMLAAVGMVLYAVVELFSYYYGVADTFRAYKRLNVSRAMNGAFVYLSISTLLAVLFKRQLTAMAGVILTISTMLALRVISENLPVVPGWLWIYFRYHIYVSFKSTLAVCPTLLCASLIVFARGNLWRRTKGSVAMVYSLLAIGALVPTFVGVNHAFPRIKRVFGPERASIRLLDSTANGNRMLLKVSPGDYLVSVDRPARRTYIVEKGRSVTGSLSNRNGDGVIFTKSMQAGRKHYFGRLFASDFEGNNKTRLYGALRVALRGYSPYWTSPWNSSWPKESPDGKYLALTQIRSEAFPGKKFVAITDPVGKMLGRYDAGALEEEQLTAIGWDSESRFHFRKIPSKGPPTWTVRPDRIVPERAEFLPRDVTYNARYISPDGRWLQYINQVGKTNMRGVWLYNIFSGESHLISKQINLFDLFEWSQDGRMIALLEMAPDHSVKLVKKYHYRLISFEPETGKRRSLPIENCQDAYLNSWSASSNYLLLSVRPLKSEAGKMLRPRQWSWKPHVYSVESERLVEIEPPSEEWTSLYRQLPAAWIGDELAWTVKNRLIAAGTDGSNPREILRYEDGKFYFDGEEQS